MSKARDLASGAPAPAGVSTTELGYVDGVTSAIQTQLDTKSAIANDFTAGKNILINGGFDIFQRGTSSSTQGVTCADRWYNVVSGTTTFSQDTSVPTSQIVQYSYKWTTGAATSYGQYYQALESATVKPLRGELLTFSFWVKTTGTAFSGVLNADAAYSNSTDAYVSQSVGVTFTGAQSITPTATWTKYSGTITVPADAVGLKIGLVPTATQASGVVVYIAAVQLEVSSTASPFARAGGTIQGELAACQRYYWRENLDTFVGGAINGFSTATTTFQLATRNPVAMRVGATAVDFSALRIVDTANSAYAITNITLLSSATNKTLSSEVTATISGGTAGRWGLVQGNGSGYLGFSAEL